MVANDRQYRLAKAALRKAQDRRAQLGEFGLLQSGDDPAVANAQAAYLDAEIAALEKSVLDYEMLRSGHVTKFAAWSMEALGSQLVDIRIAKRISQKELADLLGLKEQQIQRYEQEAYAGTNLQRLGAVVSALQATFEASFTIGTEKPESQALEWLEQLPIQEMIRRKWIPNHADREANFEEARSFIEANSAINARMLHKQNLRVNSRINIAAVRAWQARVSQVARERLARESRIGDDTQSLVAELRKLTAAQDGPAKVGDLLSRFGITFVVEPHLERTHLDGAAFLLDQRYPVIALTLRYDRLDNFWFILFHELGHILQHRDKGLIDGFFDDVDESETKSVEAEADQFALDALIPQEIWKNSFVRFAETDEEVIRFAEKIGVGPSVVAGRLRKERNDYQTFNNLIGKNQVQKFFWGGHPTNR